jgi:hypothetical protein
VNTTIELPTGKIIDLNRFVALIPQKNHGNEKYLLLLEGYAQPINIDSNEITILKQYLALQPSPNSNGSWDREEQIRQNQPKIEKLRKRIERMKQEQPSPEKAAAFEAFKKTIDASRPVGQKLYEQ